MSLGTSFTIGVSAGLRSMTPLCAISLSARAGVVDLDSSGAAILRRRYAPLVTAVLAAAELVGDKLPFAPSRKAFAPFAGRIVTGALAGSVVSARQRGRGAIAGICGAVVGTLVGAAARKRLAEQLGRDVPAALLEDLAAIALALGSSRSR